MSEQEIIQILQDTKQKALALYSQFHVAALIETADGEFITGINIESSSYGLTICAERVALFKALSEGKTEFKRVYVMADSREPCPPCGACRQVLMDYAANIEVVMYSREGDKKIMNLTELLPYAFRGDQLT